MPSLTVHLQQAELNESAAIDNEFKHPHVSVIMCFYAALHYLEAYAKYRGESVYESCPDKTLTQHQRRLSYITDISAAKQSSDLSIIYSKLQFVSEKARYLKKLQINSQRYFKLSASSYIEELKVFKEGLQIDLIKASMDVSVDNE